MRRVLLVRTPALFGEGMQRLLAQESDLEVTGFVAKGQAELAAEIGRIKPDVMILAGKLKVPADACHLAPFLNNWPDMRVMVVSEVDNMIHVYDKQRMVVAEARDLFDLIRRS